LLLAIAGQFGDYFDVVLPDATAAEEFHIISAKGEDGLAAKCGAAQKDRAEENVRNILQI
jgi:hypothetical protein